MMYMHYCQHCHRVHMLNGHKQFCPKCHQRITELKLSYLDYVSMDATQSTTYRMYKYSKWYKEMQRQMVQPTIHSYTIREHKPMENAVSIF